MPHCKSGCGEHVTLKQGQDSSISGWGKIFPLKQRQDSAISLATTAQGSSDDNDSSDDFGFPFTPINDDHDGLPFIPACQSEILSVFTDTVAAAGSSSSQFRWEQYSNTANTSATSLIEGPSQATCGSATCYSCEVLPTQLTKAPTEFVNQISYLNPACLPSYAAARQNFCSLAQTRPLDDSQNIYVVPDDRQHAMPQSDFVGGVAFPAFAGVHTGVFTQPPKRMLPWELSISDMKTEKRRKQNRESQQRFRDKRKTFRQKLAGGALKVKVRGRRSQSSTSFKEGSTPRCDNM